MRSKWIAIAATISLMLLSYTLSYAPYLAFRYSDEHLMSTDEHHRGFEPVEWLIDFTPIYHPMIAWTELWECEDRMIFASGMRDFEREMKQLVDEGGIQVQ